MIILHILTGLAVLVNSANSYEKESIVCDDIDVICQLNGLIYYSDPQAECDKEADDGEVLVSFPNPEICNCGLKCIKYLEEGEECKTSSVHDFPTEICGPMLSCSSNAFGNYSTCQYDKTKTCVQERIEYEKDQEEGILGSARMKPNCDDEGKYSAKQCSPDTTCYCTSEDGERLFGEAAFSRSENMTCECARSYVSTQEKGLDIAMRCLPDGSFDSLQCIGDVCYCLDSVTLELIQGPLHVSMITHMICYDKDYHSSDNLNPCEREVSNQIAGVTMDDTLIVDSDIPSCSPDGHYESVQRRGTDVVCVDIYGETIDDFVVSALDIESVNCNCARRRSVLKAAGEFSRLPTCQSNGNYHPRQISGLFAYCVDENGNQVGDSVPSTDVTSLICP